MIVLVVISAIVMAMLSVGTIIECVTEGVGLWNTVILVGVVTATIIVIKILFSGGYNLP